MCNFFMGCIAYKYFKEKPFYAQMVCFMLLANQKVEYLMYNDQFAALFICKAMAVLFLDTDPLQASISIGMALSIKAPVIMLLPAYLGSIHFKFGTKHLIGSLMIILGI